MRPLVVLLSAFLSFHAAAQTPVQQIVATSPQLVVFAGSDANLQALANGLTLGQPVTLVTQTSNGLLQIVTFTPPNALSATDTARALEQARTALIVRGISQPSAQQIGAALMGGTLVTSSGQVALPGVLTGSIPTNALQVRNEFAGGGAVPLGGSATNFQALTTGLRQGTPITLTGLVNGVQQSVTFTPNSGPLSAEQANLALQMASQTLASVGITNPTPDQIRAALVGGAVQVTGGSLILQGALQNRTTATSASGLIGTSRGVVGTSNSPLFGTSDSPTFAGPTVAAPIISSPPPGVSGAGSTSGAPIVGSTGAPIVGGSPTPILGGGGTIQSVPRLPAPGR
jgi:hypothetical protein